MNGTPVAVNSSMTVSPTATTTYIVAHAHGGTSPLLVATGQVHGFAVAIWWGVGILLLAAIVVAAVAIAGGGLWFRTRRKGSLDERE